MDEFGYPPPDAEAGPLLYDLLACRYERGATIITSNKSLLHHGDVYHLKGDSYRLKDKPGLKPEWALVSGQIGDPAILRKREGG